MTAALMQVAATFAILHGEAATPVRNPSAAPVSVTVALATEDPARADRIGRPVRAVVSPSSFSLAPGETQTVRFRLKESFPAGTTLRVVTTFTPADADAPARGAETAAVSRVVVVTRLVTKARVE